MARDLEVNRFEIKPESLDLMKEVRAFYERLKREFPKVLMGVTFFGSRTLGKEKRSSADEGVSDLDYCIFIDFEGLEQAERSNVRKQLSYQFEKFIRDRGAESTPFILDCSTKMTDKVLERFKIDAPRINDDLLKGTQNSQEVGLFNWHLVARFFLGTGQGLYQNRKYILDRLEEDKEGEKYFRILMQYLQFCERTIKTSKRPEGLPRYENYPQTIEEAKKYFLTE